MTPPPDPSRLTDSEKDALIVEQWRQIVALSARIAEREAKLGIRPILTASNGDIKRIAPARSRKGAVDKMLSLRIRQGCSTALGEFIAESF